MQFHIFDQKSFNNDNAAQLLKPFIEESFSDDGDSLCFYRHPLMYTEGGIDPTFVIVSRHSGVFVIKAFNYDGMQIGRLGEEYWEIDGEKTDNCFAYFDDYCYSLKNEIFRPANKLAGKVEFSCYCVFPFAKPEDVSVLEPGSAEVVFDDFRSVELFQNRQKKPISGEEWTRLVSVVQGANSLNKHTGIKLNEPIKNLREAIIFNDQRICIFDDEQLRAGLQLTDSAERIRGLAGTGKTIILAMKAARMHYLHPEMTILYTFYTQSLYAQAKNLISRFYRAMKGIEPDWEKLHVLHAWGGRTTKPGVYYNTCRKNGLAPLSVDFKRSRNPFAQVCASILDKKIAEEYDCVLIDEAQDMPVEFFRVIARITKAPKRIVWAYDELQTLGDVHIPGADELFGLNPDRSPVVELYPDKDFILRRSYRNPRKVLFLAVALGFGLYSDGGVTQMIDQEDTWEALGFRIKSGGLIEGQEVEIERPEENSPNKPEDFYPRLPPVNIRTFDAQADEIQFISDEILRLIRDEGVNPRDIMVIDLDSRSSKSNLVSIQTNLFMADVRSIIPGIIDDADDFFIDNNVTLTTARRAKGNEAPVVFVMGLDTLYSAKAPLHERMIRNMAFVSITRAKGWCFCTCSGVNVARFKAEIEKIQRDFPVLRFLYPTKEKMAKINRINYLVEKPDEQDKIQDKISLLEDILGDIDPEYIQLLLNTKMKDRFKKIAEELD